MVILYILVSLNSNHFYIGITTDLDKRLIEHNSGLTKSNKAYAPWKVIYTEKFENFSDARKREKYFKSGSGREFLKEKFPI